MEKFLHIHLLISIIFSIVLVVLGNEKSFAPLNLSYIMEARERFMFFDTTKLANPPMPSYTFSIYHRDLFEKSKFKDYDSLLENRLARSQARAKHLASIFENGNANGTTIVQYSDGEYVGSFMLGSEQLLSYLLLDTGSSLVWWQCGPCRPNKCYEQKHDPLYDLTKSKTYQKLDCLAQRSKCLLTPNVFECRQYDNTCVYDYKYAEGTTTRGWIAEDVITFLSDKKQVRILFGCGGDQTTGKQFSGEFSGIAGLTRRYKVDGYGGYSLQSQFDADIMAICLPEIYSTNPSTISFHTTPFKRKLSVALVPFPKLPQFYAVNLLKILINDKEVPSFPSLSPNFGNGLTGGCIVDIGSTVTIFPEDFYTKFRDTFRKEVRDIPLIDAPLGDFDTCYLADPGEVPTFPIVKMYFDHQNPENLLLLEQEQVMIHERGLFCLAFIKWKQPVALLGNNQLQGIGLTFDTATNTLSFDFDACKE